MCTHISIKIACFHLYFISVWCVYIVYGRYAKRHSNGMRFYQSTKSKRNRSILHFAFHRKWIHCQAVLKCVFSFWVSVFWAPAQKQKKTQLILSLFFCVSFARLIVGVVEVCTQHLNKHLCMSVHWVLTQYMYSIEKYTLVEIQMDCIIIERHL